MNRESNNNPGIMGASDSVNSLWQYVQNLSPETISQLSRPQSPEVLNVMERNIVGLLGNLPIEQFDVEINTSREHLGRLLESAIISGYFLRNVEQQMFFQQSWQNLDRPVADFE